MTSDLLSAWKRRRRPSQVHRGKRNDPSDRPGYPQETGFVLEEQWSKTRTNPGQPEALTTGDPWRGVPAHLSSVEP